MRTKIHCSDMELDNLISIADAIASALVELKERDEIPMTRQQAAVYLGVSVSTINNYAKKGLKMTTKHGIAGYLPSDLKPFKK